MAVFGIDFFYIACGLTTVCVLYVVVQIVRAIFTPFPDDPRDQ